MVSKLTNDCELREDLMQEALVHMWLLVKQRPGQQRSWYLQSCKFRLQHYLAAGRSVDSVKRRGRQVPLQDRGADGGEEFGQAESENLILDVVSTRDILTLLQRQLSPRDRFVLLCLAEGMGVREIARRLGLSHPIVCRVRQRIAQLAAGLGVTAPRPPNGHRHNRKTSPSIKRAS